MKVHSAHPPTSPRMVAAPVKASITLFGCSISMLEMGGTDDVRRGGALGVRVI